jgi:hypothetical protein
MSYNEKACKELMECAWPAILHAYNRGRESSKLRYILFTNVFVHDPPDLFVLLQPEAKEGVGGDRTGEGINAGGDTMRIETSARRTSTAESAGDDTEVDVNMSAETLTTDVAATPEV